MINFSQGPGSKFWNLKALFFLTALLFPSLSFAADAADFNLSVNSVSGAPGSSISVSVSGDFGKAVNSAQFTLKFNPDLLTVSGVTAGSANSSWVIVNNPKIPGTVIVGMFNASGPASAVSGPKRQITVIKFTVNSHPQASASSSGLALSKVDFDTASVTHLVPGTFNLQR